MFRIKICGITRLDDAVAAERAGADAIGLNFFEGSPRCISRKNADAIAAYLPAKVSRIGVYVNADYNSIEAGRWGFRLQGIQLHGDESPEFLANLYPLSPQSAAALNIPLHVPLLIRARRMSDRGVAEMAEDLEACRSAGRLPDAVLVDALTPGRYGGTGHTVSWAGLADYRRWLGDIPLILAGGLTPENVAEAIRSVRPQAVDVASGVESAPGIKDHDKVVRFVDAAREAFASIE